MHIQISNACFLQHSPIYCKWFFSNNKCYIIGTNYILTGFWLKSTLMKLDSLPFVYQQIFRESKGNNELQKNCKKKKKNQVTRVLQNRSQKWKIKRLTARALFSLVSMLIKSHWMTGTAAFLFSANFLTDDMCAWKSNEQHLPPFFYKRAPLHHMHFQAVFLRSRS